MRSKICLLVFPVHISYSATLFTQDLLFRTWPGQAMITCIFTIKHHPRSHCQQQKIISDSKESMSRFSETCWIFYFPPPQLDPDCWMALVVAVLAVVVAVTAQSPQFNGWPHIPPSAESACTGAGGSSAALEFLPNRSVLYNTYPTRCRLWIFNDLYNAEA